MQVAYANPRWFNVALGVQFFGRQFDDDLNVRAVPGESEPGLAGLRASSTSRRRARSARNLDVFFGVQNMLDKEYIVGTLPTTIGSPRLVHGGVRVRFGRSGLAVLGHSQGRRPFRAHRCEGRDRCDGFGAGRGVLVHRCECGARVRCAGAGCGARVRGAVRGCGARVRGRAGGCRKCDGARC